MVAVVSVWVEGRFIWIQWGLVVLSPDAQVVAVPPEALITPSSMGVVL
jgi:hypothetical protein